MRFTRITIVSVAIAAAVGVVVLTRVAHAQGAKTTINDPSGPLPDPTHIPIVLPKDIKWTGQEGRMQQAVLFGDPNKPGLYGVIKWFPGVSGEKRELGESFRRDNRRPGSKPGLRPQL